MTKVVNKFNFSSYPTVVALLDKLEGRYSALEALGPKSSVPSCSPRKLRSDSNEARMLELSEAKEEKKSLQEEIPAAGAEEKVAGKLSEDPFDVLVRAATTSSSSPVGAVSKRLRPRSTNLVTEGEKPNKRAKNNF